MLFVIRVGVQLQVCMEEEGGGNIRIIDYHMTKLFHRSNKISRNGNNIEERMGYNKEEWEISQ